MLYLMWLVLFLGVVVAIGLVEFKQFRARRRVDWANSEMVRRRDECSQAKFPLSQAPMPEETPKP